MDLTETGDFGGNIFATGVAPVGDSEARFVETDVPGAGTKMMARFQYEAGKKPTPPSKRSGGKKRAKNRKLEMRAAVADFGDLAGVGGVAGLQSAGRAARAPT